MAGPAVLRSLRTLRPRTPAVCAVPVYAPVCSVLSPSCVWRSSPVRTLQLCSALCAGHNKWSKVKHVKGPKDDAKGKMFTKFGMMIRIAVKEGGPNPDLNLNLAHILEQCRGKNMPRASIEAAIKGVEKSKPMTEGMYEARGPGGCLLLIEILTDNNTRTHQGIKFLLNKNGGMFAESVRHNFQKRGMVVVPAQNITTEQALEMAIEAGAEDVQDAEDEEEQPTLQFICDMTNLKKVRTSLEELGMKITSTGWEFLPNNLSSLDQDQLDNASTLIEALSDHPDVVRVWDNIQAHS